MIGMIGSAHLAYEGVNKTNQSNEASTAKQIAFQQSTLDQSQAFARDMSSSAHRREVADLRAAGLNPLLSGTGGMGSSSPHASGMPGAQYTAQNPAGHFPGAFASAIDVLRTRAETENIKAQRGVIQEQKRKTGHEADQAESDASIADYERRVRDFQRHLGDKDNNNVGGIEADARRRYEEDRAGSTASALERNLDESSGELMRTLKRLGITGSTATQLFQLMQGRRGSYPADRPYPRRR